MAATWTAQIIDRAQTGGGLEVAVVLSDGATKFVQRYQTDRTLANLRAQILRTIADRVKLETKDELPIGLVIDTTPDVPPDPTDADRARAAFLADVTALRRAERIAADGLTTKTDVEALRAKVQTQLDADPTLETLL